MAFGATGTGKSLTISAIDNVFNDRGLLSRSLEDLIRMRDDCKGKMKVVYTITFIEATNMHVCDLLDENVPIYGGNTMKLLKKVLVNDLQSCLEEIYKGEGRKSVNKKGFYTSHLAHSILTITASCRLNDELKPLQVVSKLHFVDLAGVDTVGNESCFYKKVIEIGMANVTKSQIEQFVLTLIENVTTNIIVKQKLNILIQYLGEALSHSSQMRLIGHIRTGKTDLMMTLSMLRLSNIIRGLKCKKAEKSIIMTEEGRIKYLEATVKEMRRELEIQSMILNSSLSKNLTQDRLSHLKNLAESYLSNKINELVVISFSDVNTILQVFKERFFDLDLKKKKEVDAAYQEAYDKAVQTFKSGSRASSLKKLPTMKSKESITTSQSSKASKRSLSWKGSKLSGDSKEKGKKGIAKDSTKQGLPTKKSSSQSSAVLEPKSSKLGSKIFRKSLKKRSSIVSETKEEKSEFVDQPLPEEMPDREQAWKEFTIDENFGYNTLKSQLDEEEETAKKAHLKYLNEIRNLQDMKQNFEVKKEALEMAEMGKQLLGVVTVDEEGNMKISDAETEYRNSIKQLEINIVEQQETLLFLQAELRLQLEMCKQTRKGINEQYEAFCFENYKTLVPDLKEKSTEMVDLLEQTSEFEKETRDDITKDLSECYNDLIRYESLRNMMFKQQAKMQLRKLKNKKWIRSSKP